MPNFSNPFVGNVPDRKMTLEELVRAMRLNVAAEEEATFLYMAHAEATDHPLAKKVLIDIANEERVHVGEFNRLIRDPDRRRGQVVRGRRGRGRRDGPGARRSRGRGRRGTEDDRRITQGVMT